MDFEALELLESLATAWAREVPLILRVRPPCLGTQVESHAVNFMRQIVRQLSDSRGVIATTSFYWRFFSSIFHSTEKHP